MSNQLNIEGRLYRHAKFLQSLTLNEYETKLIRLFQKSNQNFTLKENTNYSVEDHSLKNRKVAVEY